MSFDLTITVADILAALGGIASVAASASVLLYRVCVRLDTIERKIDDVARKANIRGDATTLFQESEWVDGHRR